MSTHIPHTNLFKETLQPALLSSLPDEATLSTHLQRILDEIEEARQQYHIEEVDFLVYLAQKANQLPPPKGWIDWLEHVQSDDLCLACACSHHSEVAQKVFWQTYDKTIDQVLLRFQKSHIPPDDLKQIVMEKIFVGTEDKPPKLLKYSGQGFLENWIRVTTLRTCLDCIKGGSQQKREQLTEEDALLRLQDSDFDVELEFLKQEYRGHFKESFAKALTHLSSRERNLLRQHLVSGLNIDQIGTLYHIHRATAARRIAKARQALLDATRQELMAKLEISKNEFESIMNLIQSRLDVSMIRLLGHTPSVIQDESS